jgi:hypothetical protein
MNSLKSDITFSQDLSVGVGTPLSYTTSIGRRFRLEQIIFHASVAITETITITLDSGKGANYDTVLRVKSLVAEQNYVFVPTGDNNFYAGDELKIECTAANDTGTIYGIIKAREILI